MARSRPRHRHAVPHLVRKERLRQVLVLTLEREGSRSILRGRRKCRYHWSVSGLNQALRACSGLSVGNDN